MKIVGNPPKFVLTDTEGRFWDAEARDTVRLIENATKYTSEEEAQLVADEITACYADPSNGKWSLFVRKR